jgi:hypothetical protein
MDVFFCGMQHYCIVDDRSGYDSYGRVVIRFISYYSLCSVYLSLVVCKYYDIMYSFSVHDMVVVLL